MKRKALALLLCLVMMISLVPVSTISALAAEEPEVTDGGTEITVYKKTGETEPVAEPTAEPSVEPTAEPSAEPTAEPSAEPTAEPAAEPTVEPTAEPTQEPEEEVEILDIPPCDCSCPMPNIAVHSYSCARQVYLRTLADSHSGSELYRVWSQLAVDEQEYILMYLRWNPFQNLFKIIELAVLLGIDPGVEVEEPEPTAEPEPTPDPDVPNVVTEIVDGMTVTVVGGENVSVSGANGVPNGAESLFSGENHWQMTLNIDAEPAPEGVGVNIGGLSVSRNTWATAYHYFDSDEELAEAQARGANIGSYAGGFYEIIPAQLNSASGTLSFTAYTFSTYTVDFYNGDNLGFSLNGGDSVQLSYLLSVLGFNIDLSQVAGVEFSNTALLSVLPQGGDWLLTSLQPFSTEEYLHLHFNNGEVFSIFVLDEQVNSPANTANGAPNEITKTKVGTAISGHPGEYEIVLTVTGTGSGSSTTTSATADIVLILDTTPSMGDSGLSWLKQAANSFLSTLLSDANSTSRVAMIQYTDMAHAGTQTRYLNQYTDNGSYFYTHASWQRATNAGQDMVPIPTTRSAANGATNTQHAMHMAETILSSAECQGNMPFVVLLTDGAPNRTYYSRTTGNISYLAYNNKGKCIHTCVGNGEISQIAYGGSGGDDASYYNKYPYENVSYFEYIQPGSLVFDTSSESSSFTGCCKSGSMKWVCAKCGNTMTKSGSSAIGAMQATLYDSYYLRQMAELFTVGVDVNTQTTTLLQKMCTQSSTVQHYYPASKSSDLVTKLTTLANTIKVIAKNAKVIDPMGPDVGLSYNSGVTTYTKVLADYTAGNANVYISGGNGLVYDAATDTLTWDIGDISYGQTFEMRYKVKIDDGIYGENIPLNEDTVLDYTDKNGTHKAEDYPVPPGEMEQTLADYTVTHWQQNLIGSAYEEVVADRETIQGNVGEQTAAAAKTYDGFTARLPISQQTIAAAGTSVAVYYDRNSYPYTITHVEKGTTNTLKSEGDTVKYGSSITVEQDSFTGFTYESKDKDSLTVGSGTNSAVVTYTRNRHELKYVVANDNSSAGKTENLPYDTAIDTYTPTQPNSDFDGWYTDPGCTIPWTKPDQMPDEDITVYGRFILQTGAITITKTGMESGENAIFYLQGGGFDGILEVVVPGNGGSVTISDVPVGYTYSVTENPNWVWRYLGLGAQSVTVAAKDQTYTVSFANQSNGTTWLGAETRQENVFGKASGN